MRYYAAAGAVPLHTASAPPTQTACAELRGLAGPHLTEGGWLVGDGVQQQSMARLGRSDESLRNPGRHRERVGPRAGTPEAGRQAKTPMDLNAVDWSSLRAMEAAPVPNRVDPERSLVRRVSVTLWPLPGPATARHASLGR